MNMNPFTPEQLRELAERLEQRNRELQFEIADARREVERAELAERAAMADDEAEAIVGDTQVLRDLQEAAQVEAALKRIAQGRYGICADCGGPIGIDRLRAEPSASRCIGCQRDHERAHA